MCLHLKYQNSLKTILICYIILTFENYFCRLVGRFDKPLTRFNTRPTILIMIHLCHKKTLFYRYKAFLQTLMQAQAQQMLRLLS